MTSQTDNPKAIVLVSGGLDSATTLAIAVKQGFQCYAMSFDYGQRHKCELSAAKNISTQIGATEQRVIKIDLGQFGGSALTDSNLDVPKSQSSGIPITYVPARNTVFLSLALAWAEVLEADHIFIGVNAVDYSGYPDCRPEYIAAFEKMANLATKVGVESESIKISTPLINKTKAEIIQLGSNLGVNFSKTISCYDPDSKGNACAKCDSCRLRAAGFIAAGITDPTNYQ